MKNKNTYFGRNWRQKQKKLQRFCTSDFYEIDEKLGQNINDKGGDGRGGA